MYDKSRLPTSPLVVHILGYPQADVRKFDDKWSGGDSPRHSALLAILLAHDWKWILRALLSCNFRFTCLFSRLKSFSSFTIHITHQPSDETTKIQTMPPVRNRSRRNSALGIQNQYGDDPAAAFADLFGAPEDAADFDLPPGAYEGGNHRQSDNESTSCS